MRIPCPFCGERDLQEYSFLGEAGLKRPDPEASDAQKQFHDYVHIRKNTAGTTSELCLHTYGCRSWIVVQRNTLTHEIFSSEFASDTLKELTK